MLLYLLFVCPFLWAGMILGISFLESWVKFKTPTLDKITGLDVGRTVFFHFHRVQIGWLILLTILYLLHKQSLMNNLLLGALISIITLQIYWFFPILSQRVDALAKGMPLSPSYAHAAYGLGEIIKFFALLAFGVNELNVLF